MSQISLFSRRRKVTNPYETYNVNIGVTCDPFFSGQYFEEWRDTPYEGYSVSSLGRVRGRRKNKIMKPLVQKNGNVVISINGKNNRTVGSLVAEAFMNNYDRSSRKKIMHIDGNALNNRVENLTFKK